MEPPLSPFNLVKVYLEKSDMFPQISILELIAQAIMLVQFIGIKTLFGHISSTDVKLAHLVITFSGWVDLFQLFFSVIIG